MKKALHLIILLALLAGCSKEEEITLTVTKEQLTFTADGSEQTVSVTSNGDWYCANTVDWLLLRQQQSSVRVIVDPNTTGSARSTTVKLMIDTKVMAEISVSQAAGNAETSGISVSQSSVSAKSGGETFSIEVKGSTQWTIENGLDWCTATKSGNGLSIVVARNYGMKERTGSVSVVSGSDSRSIAVSQAACQWYESFEMVEVKGGTFYMGAQKDSAKAHNYDAAAFLAESPVHQVTLKTFSIGKYEVTQAQWAAAMADNPSAIHGTDLPVGNVTWIQAQQFIRLLNEKTGQTYRLPTEAEWEYAAKGGTESLNYTFSGNNVLGTCGWYYSNSGDTVHPVGSKEPNELGIYDMSGNVREWCSDWFDYYAAEKADNPKGPEKGIMKVNRGGSWTTPASNCRNTFRLTNRPSEAAQDLGFRLVLAK